MPDRLVIVPLRDEHIEMLAEFYRVAWRSTASADDVALSRNRAAINNQSEPGVPLPAAVAIQGGQIIGYCGTLAVRFWKGGRAYPAYWAKGLMVLPEFQNGPVGFMLLKELTKCSPLIGAFTVNPAASRLFGALGYKDLGLLPNRVKPISVAGALSHLNFSSINSKRLSPRSRRFLSLMQQTRLPQFVGAGIDVILRKLMPRTDGALKSDTQVRVTESEIDALWREVAAQWDVGSVRDAIALMTRYGDGLSNPHYRYVTVRRLGELVAVAVLKVPRAEGDGRLAGVRVACVSDLLMSPIDFKGRAKVLAAVEECARELGADALWCSASAEGLNATLKRRGYLSVPSTVHFFLRALSADGSWEQPVTSWWLTRGDSEADSNF